MALANIKILLPPLSEQCAINEALDAAEEKIRLTQIKWEQYQTLKRGLMQKLLTGEWRVKIDEEPVSA